MLQNIIIQTFIFLCCFFYKKRQLYFYHTHHDKKNMKLLVFVLNKEELLEDVLCAYVETGISGATILDSEGIGRFLTYEVPFLTDFKDFVKGNKPYNRTILSVIKDEKLIPRLEKLLEKICGNLDDPGTGILFTLPVDYARGLLSPKEE